MKEEGTLKTDDSGKEIFWDKYNKAWYPVSEAHMGHKTDAVDYWNDEGIQHGKKSPEVLKVRNGTKIQIKKTTQSKKYKRLGDKI